MERIDMPFLYQDIDAVRRLGNGNILKVPSYVSENLAFELRPYQIAAFENYITWFESDKRPNPIQNLFHMATGSGKTLIMAGLILYLYKKGYRNFLFFVNLSNIVKKTKENFLNPNSSKYLFSNEIRIDGEQIQIKEVSNFQNTDESSINICFTTTQGLHSDMWFVKENAISINDFANKKVVLISDEAHHLNVYTRRRNQAEEANHDNWEYTVHCIFERNRENVLLEFTATCDLENQNICNEYENKIIFDYPLSKFRTDGYSKEIKTLRTDADRMNRAIQAIILSQYRLKVFQDNRLSVKPVVLFKSKCIMESKNFMESFIQTVSQLTGDRLREISELAKNNAQNILQKAYNYFKKKNITFDMLAQELKDDFSAEHCISANDDKDVDMRQIILNTLEDANNPYRAIFEVKKLDEGWDVLNLFDIVRLYENRDGRNGRPGKSTISEAQLIGRGARYCPFQIENEQEKYKRKYDSDIDNPLRVCEELYYHCQNDARYIDELHTALREIGVDFKNQVNVDYILKEEFKEDPLYKEGYVFANERVLKSRKDVDELLPSVRDHFYAVRLATGQMGEDVIMEEDAMHENQIQLHTKHTNILEIAEINYAIVYKALCKYNVFKFNILRSYFPNLKSTREFITSEKYLGSVKIDITSRYENPSPSILFMACKDVLGKISKSVSSIEETYEGTKEFKSMNMRAVFKDKRCNYTKLAAGGIGYSQNDNTVSEESRLNLTQEDWFAFNDNFGTSEEKAFVAYFKTYVGQLKERYDKVFLVRNERQLHVYSFENGERFEPDYLLFLHSPKQEGYEQLQIFIEPKGEHLLETDKWKEDFLLALEKNAVPTIKFVDDNQYKIWGFHFFNREKGMNEFQTDMGKILNPQVE